MRKLVLISSSPLAHVGNQEDVVRVDQALVAAGVQSRLVLQVHDDEHERDDVGSVVIDIMRHAVELDVPLEVNVSWGTTWADAKS